MIAKQKRLDPSDTDHDTIDWYTTDPVTGTEGTFSYTLTAGGTEVEESEPLGQKVHMFDPDIPNSLPAGAQWGNADDPEWQCTLARNMDKDFYDKPVHCQKAYHEEKWLTTYVEKKGNPTAIPPQLTINTNTSEQRKKAKAAAATHKFGAGQDNETVIPEADPIAANNAEYASTSSDCYTFYNLIYENEDIQRYRDEAWEKTVRSAEKVERDRSRNSGPWRNRHSGAEHGGAVTFDESKNTHQFWEFVPGEPPTAGNIASIPDAGDQLKGIIARDKSGGGTGKVLLVIHTHPPIEPVQKSGPFANEDQRQALLSWDPRLVTAPRNQQRPSGDDLFAISGQDYIGIVVFGYGKDNFAVYGSGNTDINTLKKMCIGTYR